MSELSHLLTNNEKWSQRITAENPDYFPTLAKQQTPEYLWIGCADSRVPANEIVGMMPGELFVHRNVANLVYASDLNCLSVIEFAVDVLKVKHIIVCGHYGCGGVKAALQCSSHGLIDNWLTKIRDIHARNQEDIAALGDDEIRLDHMCELNVIDQVKSVSHTTIVQQAWARGQELTIHGWIYGLKNGKVKDLGVSVDRIEQVASAYRVKLS
jgi:carbonic anhydrase